MRKTLAAIILAVFMVSFGAGILMSVKSAGACGKCPSRCIGCSGECCVRSGPCLCLTCAC